MSLCLCSSGLDFNQCCAPILDLSQKAVTAEALMRARYTAYTQANIPFIMNSTLPSSRSDSDETAMRTWAEQSEWVGLEIVSTQAGTANDTQGTVEFIARYKLNGIAQQHHERSTFVKQNGEWFFEDGQVIASGPTEKAAPIVNTNKQGRNDPCACGSGKKFKKCCGAA